MEEYFYDLEIVFNATGDNIYPEGFKSKYTDIQDIKDDVLSQISINVYKREADNA